MIQNKTWKKYIERSNSFTYVSIYHHAYGPLLKSTTGFGFTDQLYAFNGNTVTYYKTELEEAYAHFFDLIKNKDTLLDLWYTKALEYEKVEDYIINEFKDISFEDICIRFDSIMDQLHEIFMYLTVIPFRILDSVEYSLREGQDIQDYQGTIEKFQRFRKKSRNPLHELVLDKIWRIAAKKIDYQNYMDLSFLTVEELSALFNCKIFPNMKEIQKRKQSCIFYEDSGSMIFTNNASFQKKFIKNNSGIDKLNGNVVCKGGLQYTRGKVCVINRPHEMSKFNPGDIIVSINSTPELLPILKQCSAIVTDEGGLTCHASIVSRELNKPCITATEQGTKVFRDGDLIEVDLEKGVVRKMY